MNSKTFTIADVCAGIGGFIQAFENLGGNCVFSSEIDKFARKTYEANYGVVPSGDILKILLKNIPYHDIFTCGFPCQPYSLAGLRRGLADVRSEIFYGIIRILDVVKPQVFFLENVKRLLSDDKGRTFKFMLDALQNSGYYVSYKVLDSRQFVPQHRERLYIVGFRKQVNFEFPVLSGHCPKLQDILEDNVSDKYTLSDNTWNSLQRHRNRHEKKGNGFGYGIAGVNGTTRTLLARYYKDGSDILINQVGKNPRKLTPRECARLMGYSDQFKIVCSDTQAYKQFGNSVVIPVVARIAKEIVSFLD